MTKLGALALALIGCNGGMKSATTDAPVHDDGGGHGDAGSASVDGPTTAPIAVTVLPDYYQDTIANLPVVFSHADGTFVALEMTDAQGHASHTVTGATMVTLIKPSGNQGTVTIVDVAPGTALRFGSLYTKRAATATMHATWPSATADAFYDVETRCGGFGAYYQGGSTTVELDGRCAGTVDATIAAYYNDRVQSYLTLSGQAITDGGTLAFTGAWQPALTSVEHYTNVPNGTVILGVLTETYGGERFFDADAFTSSPATDNANVNVYTLPPATGSVLDEELQVDLPATREFVSRRMSYTDPLDVDLGAALVPEIASVDYDAVSGRVSWTTEAGAAPQVVRAELHYPGTTGSYPTWIVVAPGTVTSVTPPELPDSLAAYRVTGTVQGFLALYHFASTYAAVVGDVDLWLGRSNIDYGEVDFQAAPAALEQVSAATEMF